MKRSPWVAIVALAVACAGSQGARGPDSPFEAPGSDLARELAPDLYARALDAWSRAEDARGRKEQKVVDDLRDAAELWLAAAVVEAERVQLARHLDQLQREEERWAKQLARDQEASAVVANDISRYRARAVALREAERIFSLSESPTTNSAVLDAVLTRVRFNLALAEAFGASDEDVAPLRSRTEALERKRPKSGVVAERLLLDTEALLGDMRAQWPTPRPGASTELVETARVTGFSSDRTGAGVVVRSERFFTSGSQISAATVRRFEALLSAFPHGPVACQVAVPQLESRVWARRVAELVDRLSRIAEPERVSTSMVATDSLGAGIVQCTFAAYREP